jgi:hypothetical protein
VSRAAPFALAAAAALAALPVHAEVRAVSALPEVKAAAAAPDAPSGIPRSEHAAMIWVSAPRSVAAQKGEVKRGKMLSAVVVASGPVALAGTAADRGTGLKIAADEPASDACLSTSKDGITWAPVATSAMLLEGGASEISLDPSDTAREIVSDDVFRVRSSRLVEGAGDKATLERTDAWIDLRTGGAREIARQTLALAVVQRLPGGVVVYGAREDQRVLLLVRPPTVPTDAKAAPGSGAASKERPKPRASLVLDTREGQAGHCAYRQVSLAVDKAGIFASESVLGRVTVPLDDDTDGGSTPGMRSRAFRVSLTESWLGDEPGPALGATFGWTSDTARPSPRGRLR